MLAPAESVQLALDKDRILALAGRLGLDVPRSTLHRSGSGARPASALPTFLKPASNRMETPAGLRMLHPQPVTDLDTRERALTAWLPHTDVLEQEHIPGFGVGLEALCRHGRLVWHFAHAHVHELPLTGGASPYRRSMPAPAPLLDAARVLLDARAWLGVAMVEFKARQDGTFVLMEINARFWGSLALSIDAGVDFPRGLDEMARGTDPDSQPGVRSPICTRHLQADLEWFIANPAADRRDPLLLTRSTVTSFGEFARVLVGREKWNYFRVDDPGPGLAVFSSLVRRMARGVGAKVVSRVQASRLRRHHRNVLSQQLPHAEVVRVIFLCHGSICRSAFAERPATTTGLLPHASSAGFDEIPGRPSPTHVAAAASERNTDLTGWSSQTISAAALAGADLIVLMDRRNWEDLRERYPAFLNRATMLGLFVPEQVLEIPDPYELDLNPTRAVLGLISASFTGWLRHMNAEERSGS